MVRSMTGYSRIEIEEAGFTLWVSAKSTNHRFLDVQVRPSAALEPLESLLRRLVRNYVTRGHLELAVVLERAGSRELQLDHDLLNAYIAAWQKLRNEFGFTAELDLVALLRIPGVVGASKGALSPEELEIVQPLLERVTVEALECLNEMRAREGEALERDIRSRLERLRELSGGIHQLANSVPQFYQRRLESRIEELLGSVEVDASRLAVEVAYLVSRSDITEELTRFECHLEQATQLLEESSEVGKKLDFLLQEMNREANTLLSKTSDVPEVGLEIGRRAIEMKTEIEKLREQAQNIE